MARRPASAVTISIYLGTLAALVLVATLSVVIYRSAVGDAVAQHSTQQLALVRTSAVGIAGEIQSLSSQLRQFNGLPSVQTLDVPRLGQRVEASFGHNSAVLGSIARVDAGRRLYYWTPSGQLMANGEPFTVDPDVWAWASDPANMSQIRVLRGWSNARPEQRALTMPVWRTAPSIEVPNPDNGFNGLVALSLDLNRVVTTYLSPAMNELSDARLTVGLSTPALDLLMGPGTGGIRHTVASAHDHGENQGTSLLEDAGGRRLHAWAKLAAADETWLVASSAEYELVAGQIRRSALGQLALTATLLLAVPLAGFLVARRERRAQESRRQLERQLAESQKMEAIGKLAGGVAHDFNNMLTAILGYAGLIIEDAPAGSSAHAHAQQIRHAGESAAALTQKLLAFSRRQVLHASVVDVAALLPNLAVLIRRVIGERITVTTETAAGLWPILADPVQVEQSIVNLAINARDAMPEGGALRITAANAPRPAAPRRPDGDVKPGDYVLITVTDTGVGMDEATRARMFEPFFTTKQTGQGTGLGLATVYGFVRQCGGHVSVTSAPGKGTSIGLLLPRAYGTPDPTITSAASPAAGDHAGRETVLVVEDEDAVRAMLVESLQRAGYHVISAPSAEFALTTARSYDGTIHLLVTDVVMSGMKGPELGERLRALRPGIRVLLISGYATDVVRSGDLTDAALLHKPFSAGALTRAAREVLDAPLAPAGNNG